MKKKLAILIIGVMTIMAVACGSKENDTEGYGVPTAPIESVDEEDVNGEIDDENAARSEDQEMVGMANPWTESDKDGVLQATGIELNTPDGASNVAYSYMADGQMAQVTYELMGANWIYRGQMADELTDISGMYYEWGTQDEGQVSGRPAIYYAYAEPGEDPDYLDGMFCVQVVNWYDVVPGITYSLSAAGTELNGMDIQVMAEDIFEPMQGEVKGDFDEPDTAENQGFLGLHTRSEDGSELLVEERDDGKLDINISIVRLCVLENGVGEYGEYRIDFTAQDPNGNDIKGKIYHDTDNSITVEITDSTWNYLPNGERLTGFDQ